MLNRRIVLQGLVSAPMIGSLSSAARAQVKDKVVIGQSSDGFHHLLIYVARGLNCFRDEGLDVEVQIFQKGAATSLTAVLGGEADIYVGLPAVPMQAWLRGQRTMLFASLMNYCGSDIILSKDAAKRIPTGAKPAEKAAALKGLKIAVAGAGSITDLVVRHVARFGGLNPDRDLSIIPIGGGANMLAAFSQGTIDGYSLSAPTSTVGVVKFGGVSLFDFSADEYPPFAGLLYTGLSARDQWLSQKQDTAVRVARALQAAVVALRERPEDAKRAVQPFYANVPPEIYDVAWAQGTSAVPRTLRVELPGVTKNLDFLQQVRDVAVNLPLEQTFTNSIVDLANPQQLAKP